MVHVHNENRGRRDRRGFKVVCTELALENKRFLCLADSVFLMDAVKQARVLLW